jgi:XTP/dITP diphosphohydrolase
VPILIATSNAGKLRDFAAASTASKVDVKALPGFGSLPPVEEDGRTFAANARKKAEFYSGLAPGEIVLADDSGLEVDALDGAPGVRSARYAADAGVSPADSSARDVDAANNRHLLQQLARCDAQHRGARFVCVIAIARDGGMLQSFEGEVRGEILTAPRGNDGFGYDPLFLVPHLGKTLAELSPDEKAHVSHRGAAFRNFLAWLSEHGDQ